MPQLSGREPPLSASRAPLKLLVWDAPLKGAALCDKGVRGLRKVLPAEGTRAKAEKVNPTAQTSRKTSETNPTGIQAHKARALGVFPG
jgi:hypothetical protein